MRSKDIQESLSVLAGSTATSRDGGADASARQPGSPGIVTWARSMRADPTRIERASRVLPKGRCEFLIDCLEPWFEYTRQAKHSFERSDEDFWAIVSSTAANSADRREAGASAYDQASARRLEWTLLKITYRPIRSAHMKISIIRIFMLLAVAGGAIGDILDFPLQISVVFSILAFAVLDLLLVNRILEPILESVQFDAIVRAIKEAIAGCERLENAPPELLAALERRVSESGNGTDDESPPPQ